MSEMILISIHPRFAEAIVRGEKTVEFRRRWTKREVSHLVIYATSPIKHIVAVAPIEKIVEDQPKKLWKLSQTKGGGLTKPEILTYFEGLQAGFGICLGPAKPLRRPIDPYTKFKTFTAPQSFRFLTADEVKILNRTIKSV